LGAAALSWHQYRDHHGECGRTSAIDSRQLPGAGITAESIARFLRKNHSASTVCAEDIAAKGANSSPGKVLGCFQAGWIRSARLGAAASGRSARPRHAAHDEFKDQIPRRFRPSPDVLPQNQATGSKSIDPAPTSCWLPGRRGKMFALAPEDLDGRVG
jgi:hypothetical protein